MGFWLVVFDWFLLDACIDVIFCVLGLRGWLCCLVLVVFVSFVVVCVGSRGVGVDVFVDVWFALGGLLV